jgi:hypothetical protein
MADDIPIKGASGMNMDDMPIGGNKAAQMSEEGD